MAKAKKLESGSWNVQVFSHVEKGKRKYVSFTAPTKNEALLMAAEFKAGKKRRVRYDLTVGEALDGYIKAKESVLSPSTITEYRRMRDNDFSSIRDKRIRDLTSEDIQLFISELSREKSAKTVGNIYGLLSPALAMYQPDVTYRVTLPQKPKRRPVSPGDEEVRTLFAAASPKMKIRIALAMCGLRRGEICALEYDDLEGDVIHIHADMVKGLNEKWVIKEIPKTSESDRFLKLPPELVEMIGSGSGRIVQCNPNTITEGFTKLRDSLGLHIRFHDLRHYFASTAAVLQIPDIYTADMGGWERGGTAMKTVYQNNIQSMSDFYAKKINRHMSDIMNPKKDKNKDRKNQKKDASASSL